MVDLYCRQIALDKQVGDMLHYQKIQQRVAIVDAILPCIHLAVEVAAHVLSGDLTFLEMDGEILKEIDNVYL